MVSFTNVAESTTVGTPMAMTGTPNVSSLSIFRLLPTPAPGARPVSESCIAALMRLVFLAANASMAMTRSGCIFSTMPLTISPVSMPVMPITPGLTAATGRTVCAISSGKVSRRCRVTSIRETTLGPNASGVIFQLPSPTTRAVPCFLSFAKCCNSLESTATMLL